MSEASGIPRVSVVIVNWNTRDLLEQTLKTLYEHTRTVIFEAIVVDNGSHDGSVDMVRRSFPEVTVVARPTNGGFAVGNNEGLARSRGEYILLLNSDTIVLDSTVSGLVDLLDSEPGAGCAGARHLNEDLSLQRSIDDAPSLLNDLLSYTELQRIEFFARIARKRFTWWSNHDTERTVGWVNGACMMIRRTVLERVGGLDEDFFIYAEELDWCYRMWEAGLSVHFTPRAEVIHLGGQAMNAAVGTRLALKYTGQLRFYLKHYSRRRYLALRAIIAAVAVGRLTALLGLAVAYRFGYRPDRDTWELLTQESVVSTPGAMMRVWWNVLWAPQPSRTPTSISYELGQGPKDHAAH